MLAGLVGVTISVTLFGLRWGCVLEMLVSLINLSHTVRLFAALSLPGSCGAC
jgi:hypothetical protein